MHIVHGSTSALDWNLWPPATYLGKIILHCILGSQFYSRVSGHVFRETPHCLILFGSATLLYLTNHMGVSENSVPLNPMVLLIIIPFLNGYFIGNIPNIFRRTHIRILTLICTDPRGFHGSLCSISAFLPSLNFWLSFVVNIRSKRPKPDLVFQHWKVFSCYIFYFGSHVSTFLMGNWYFYGSHTSYFLVSSAMHNNFERGVQTFRSPPSLA